ncbi:Phakinin 49 kDa cytoskeletal protein [Larimichthys crocea]|uniref:Phakinin 49 kDa cytoskeletal protein n=1 Tax=Larimichthys crocea TaxID=215358 RepID=A0A6G0IGS4_LARCR|nr:Phakinin 49 kDa cytoskeletal protein [Larimichthys crocea]
MPLPRRRSSFLGQPSSERPAAASSRRISSATAAAPRGVFVGSASPMGGASCLGTRVSQRVLGISSVFLQGLRSSTAPVLPRAGHRAVGHGTTSAGLNSSLMEYRDKVRALEDLNQQLEDQIRLSLDRKASSAGAWGPLRREWDVYRQVSEAILDNARLILQTENVQANAKDFKDRYEDEQPFRKAVQEEISSLFKVIDDAELTKVELEEQMENMRAELRSLDQNHEQDVRVLYNQLAGREVDELDAPIETSLDQILAYIRSHWEKVTEKNRAESDVYLECKETQCGSRLSPEEEQVEALKAECNDTGCKIQSLQAETESIRALKRGLENSLSDARHWHGVELQNLGSVVSKLEAELGDVRSEIEQQRRNYDTLMSNKQRLEQEISMYHGILDGEESRFQPTEAPCPGLHPEPEGAAPDSRADFPRPPGPPGQ